MVRILGVGRCGWLVFDLVQKRVGRVAFGRGVRFGTLVGRLDAFLTKDHLRRNGDVDDVAHGAT